MELPSTSTENTSTPPEAVRGMKILNRDAFLKTVQLPSLVIRERKMVDVVLKKLRPHILKMPRFSTVESDENGNNLVFLLEINDKCHQEITTILKNIGINDFSIVNTKKEIVYENYTKEDIISAILPKGIPNVAGYSNVGHIVHLNLKSELLPFKQIIGQVLLDKISTAKTVVNKTAAIDNKFRNFTMELLAGEDDMIATAKENGCSYMLDFSSVYWNPRLCTERARFVALLDRNSVVYDVFAGIGPFSIPAAKRYRCPVVANDLNPMSVGWFRKNVSLNKVSEYVSIHNLDGREFIEKVVKVDLMERWKTRDNHLNVHVVMNLPAVALEFLDAFVGLLKDTDVAELPTVHCYCFCRKSDNEKAEMLERLCTILKHDIPKNQVSFHYVRNVAPSKNMYCVSFRLPRNVLVENFTEYEPDLKKIKC